MSIAFEEAVTTARLFAEELPAVVAEDLDDVEVIICATRDAALKRLNEVFEGEPLTETEIPVDCKGIFIGDAAHRVESEETEQEEVLELASGFVVLICDQIENIEACKLVLLHEFGHALGLDEDEVNSLGLGVTPNHPLAIQETAPS